MQKPYGKMETMGSRDGFAYFGDREGWLVAYGYWDSASAGERCLNASNIAAMCEAFTEAGAESGEDFAIETFGGAFGRGGYLLVRPGTECERIAAELRERMNDYPALNEDDWSERENEAEYENLTDWARSEYPSVDAGWLASAMQRHCAEPSAYLESWPDRDGFERDAIAAALREARKASKSAA